jgi:hypothetical protein
MQHSLTLTLGGIGSWVVIALLIAPAIGKWIGNAKKQQQDQRRRDEGGGALDIDQIAARRREQLRQASRQRSQANTSAGGLSRGISGGASGGVSGGGGSPGNMTMAERIARARAKAQYEQRSQGTAQQARASAPQVPNEGQRRALAQRQAELDRRRQLLADQNQQQARQQTQQRTGQQANQQAQQLARRQRAQAHQRAQAQARQRGGLVHEAVATPEPGSSVPRRLVPHKPQKDAHAVSQGGATIQSGGVSFRGQLTRNELRRAIVLKEILDKPIALRDG